MGGWGERINQGGWGGDGCDGQHATASMREGTLA